MRSKKKQENFVDVSFSQITLETLASEWAGQKEREDDLEGKFYLLEQFNGSLL
jgi:hypothetical protein